MNPFKEVPKARFYLRLAIPAAAAFLLSFPMIGIVARLPSVERFESEAQGTPLLPPKLLRSQGLLESSLEHLGNTRDHWTKRPPSCVSTEPRSDYLREQCLEVERRAWVALGVSTIPVVFLAVFLLWIFDYRNSFFRRARRKISQKKGQCTGTVTQPARLRDGPFAWILCLQRVSVRLPDRTQLSVLLPLDEPTPLPGQQLVVYEMGTWLGSSRRVAVLYAPHMAILAGVKPT